MILLPVDFLHPVHMLKMYPVHASVSFGHLVDKSTTIINLLLILDTLFLFVQFFFKRDTR